MKIAAKLTEKCSNLIYKYDGVKKTIDRKKCTLFLGCIFLTVAIILLLQPSSELAISARTSTIKYKDFSDSSEHPEQPIPWYSRTNSQAIRTAKRNTMKFTSAQIFEPTRSTEIPPGLSASAVLISGASNGLTKAELKDSISFKGDTFLEAGTILVGQGSSTEERLFIRFNKALLPSGSVQSITAQAFDAQDNIVGLKGSLIGTKGLKVAGGIGLGFLGGLSEGLQDSRGENGAQVRPPTLKNALLNGTAQAALEQSREIVSDIRDKTPIIEVKRGTEIIVVFGQD